MTNLKRFEKSLIEEISTLSGYSDLVVREILEFTFLRQVEFLLNEEKLQIPFIGTLNVEYRGDEFEQGNRVAIFDCKVDPSELFTRIIGDVADGESDLIRDMLNTKIENELQSILDK